MPKKDYEAIIAKLTPVNIQNIRKFFKIKNNKNRKSNMFYWYILYRFTDYKTFRTKDLRKWTEDDVIDFMQWLSNQKCNKETTRKGTPLSDSTVKNCQGLLKSMLRALKLKRLADEIKLKKTQPRLTSSDDLITEDELESALRHTKTLRERALLSYFWDTMCRITEGLSIRFSQIEHKTYIKNGQEHSYFKIRINAKDTKVKRNKIVYLIEHAQDFKQYLVSHNNFSGWQNLSQNEHFVWTNVDDYRKHRDTPLCGNTVSGIFKKIFLRAGITKRIYPHLFRGSSVTVKYRKGADMPTLKRLGGWQSNILETCYLKPTEDDVENKALAQNGIVIEQKPENLCPACGVVNNKGETFCRCGHTLDQEKFMEYRKLKEQKDTALEKQVVRLTKIVAQLIPEKIAIEV